MENADVAIAGDSLVEGPRCNPVYSAQIVGGASLGGVQNPSDYDARAYALECAKEIAGNGGVEAMINAAKTIEAYLKNG